MAISDRLRSSRTRALWAAVALVGVVTPGCTQIDNALASVPIFAFMREAPSFGPYEHPLPPPPGSVPFESPVGEALPPLEATEQALNEFAASPAGANPLQPGDAAAIELGRAMYERHCSVCHGTQGAADGPMTAEGLYPTGMVPPLVSGLALTRTDGYLYGVIRAGRGLMPAYGGRTTHLERWAIVSYISSLQQQ